MAGKLHELLAAEKNVKAVYNAMVEETNKVLGTAAHFERKTMSIAFFDAAESQQNTTKTTDMVTTVTDRLHYFFGRPFINAMDLMIQKDVTNQHALGDLVVNGTVILRGVPATTFLELEGKLDALRGILLRIPTLKSGPVWVRDEAASLWRTKDPVVDFLTRKTMVPVELSPATKEHPAQVDKVFEDKPVAKRSVDEWSGMWTSAQKADILARLDSLLIAVKKARQRANRVAVEKVSCGAVLAKFILDGPEADKLTGEDTVETD